MEWAGWPLQRILLLFTGLAFMMISIQVTLFHYRQNFRHWTQWIPVITVPTLGIVSILVGFYNIIWLRTIYTILLTLGIIAGMFGFYLHIKGVGERVDGYKLQNFMVGPPLTLPLMVSAISFLGILALMWGGF